MTQRLYDSTKPRIKTLAATSFAIVVSLGLAGCMTTTPRDSDPYDDDRYGRAGDYDTGYDPAPTGTAAYGARAVVQPRRIRGEIETRDFPRQGVRERDGRSATFRLDIGADGRVDGCRATESSGIPGLDAFTCRLIQSRFVYEPARDAQGRPVTGIAGWQQSWYLPGR